MRSVDWLGVRSGCNVGITVGEASGGGFDVVFCGGVVDVAAADGTSTGGEETVDVDVSAGVRFAARRSGRLEAGVMFSGKGPGWLFTGGRSGCVLVEPVTRSPLALMFVTGMA